MTTPLDLRAEIPALQDAAYFNYGAHGPSPRRVIEAVGHTVEHHESNAVLEDPYESAFESYDQVRARIAALLGATPDEIALTESTTDGINRVAGALDWEPGDVVVRTDLEHPAGVLPWKRLEREGVSVRVVETENGRIDTEAFAAAVEDAKLVCFSALTWTHGTMLPVETLVDIAAESDTFTLVDAVQVPGQRPLNVDEWGADAVVGAGHKWLLGPWGAGFLYVDHERANEMVPGAVGYRSVTTPTASEPEYQTGARRFEIGSMSPGPHAGLEAGIGVIQEIGVETVQDRIEGLTERLKDHIPDERLLSPREFHSGLVTVDVSDPGEAVDRLATDGIVIRALPAPDAVRVSVHAVSTEAEVDAVGTALTSE